MKVAFRQQATDYDCVPTSIINGLCFLFHRQDVPPFVVKRIYKDCLDVDAFKGTSGDATHEVAYWLNSYRDKQFGNFAVEARLIRDSQVHLRDNGKIMQCLAGKGVALLTVYLGRSEWHCILCFHMEDGWLHCYDPAPRTRRFISNEAVLFDVSARHQEANLRIRCDWLDKTFSMVSTYDDCKYILGDDDDRECLLLNKVQLQL